MTPPPPDLRMGAHGERMRAYRHTLLSIYANVKDINISLSICIGLSWQYLRTILLHIAKKDILFVNRSLYFESL